MWSIIQFLCYDLPYFLYKSADNFKWDALIIFTVYQIGRISGMRLFKKFLEGHLPYLRSEESDWKLWVTKNLVLLGAQPFIPKKHYTVGKRFKAAGAKNSKQSSKSSREGIPLEGVSQMKEIIVVADAGHGGIPGTKKADSGAIGITGKMEKDFNLTMVLKVRDMLQQNTDIKVILTRDTDVFIELKDRAKIANKAKADVFLSIHANSGTAESQGTETLYSKDLDKPFAAVIHKHLIEATGLRDRACRYQNLSVCRNTKMPAALIEPGFLSNPKEEALLYDEATQNKIAEALARGVCDYLGVEYGKKASTKSPLSVVTASTTPQTPLMGFLLDGVSYVPARPVLDSVAALWGLNGKQITINQLPVETINVDGMSYIKAKDILQSGAGRVFFDNTTAPKEVTIYPPLGGV